VIDAKLQRLTLADILACLGKSRPDAVGITAMTHEIERASETAAAIKGMLGDIPIIVGGVHLSILPEETLQRYSSFDAGVVGEGEEVTAELLSALIGGREKLPSIGGIVYRENGKVKMNTPAAFIADLDKLPYPAWEKFPSAASYRILTSRGCPYECIFCMRASGKRLRQRSPENVVGEIESVLAKNPPKLFLFSDETFTVSNKRVNSICGLIIERGLHKKIRWSATTRVDSINEEMLKVMKKAGCQSVEFGVESGNPAILKAIKKGITMAQAKDAVMFAKSLGLHVETAFILGHPNETLETACDTINFAAKLNADVIQLGIMVPYPGTEVADIARRGEGGYRIISRDWSQYNKQLGNALELDTLSRRDLELLQLAGYLKLFIYNRRFMDLLKFMANFHREAVAYLRNLFRKKTGKRGVLNFFSAVKLIFEREKK